MVLDILTGDFELDAEFAQTAANRLRERQPLATIFGLKIGADCAYIVGFPRVTVAESSSTDIKSYQDYERELPKLVAKLSPVAGVRFGLSCVDAIKEIAQESIDAEVSEENQMLVRNIQDEIKQAVGAGKTLAVKRAAVLETTLLNNLMGENTDTWIDIDSLVARWVTALVYVLQQCQKPDVENLLWLSREVINTLDYLHEAGLPAMFTLPPFRAEWERQQRVAVE